MSLKPSQIQDLLNAKREDFAAFSQDALKQLQTYRSYLAKLSAQGEPEIQKRSMAHTADLGGRLLEPLTAAEQGVIASQLVWENREQSLAWVRDRLTGIKTFAVDGSQIYPGKDLSIPVALVQIGWFENPHLPIGGYEKDTELDILTPADLQVGNSGEPVDRKVNMRRFQMETQRLIDYIEAHANAKDCLIFLDGSLVATFAEAFEAKSRQFYVECLLELLIASEQCRVPLIAYIDTSYAQDLKGMLQKLFHLPDAPSLHDAQLLNKFMNWGDRTPLFLCERPGILSGYGAHRYRVAFTYLKTTRDNYPARLEMPLWMYEEGWLERVVDWVRGEVVIGNGYPYVIETADQTAVLQADDRQTFFKILQNWAEQEDLNLRFSRKMVSKVRRR
ncbi:DNA double-strand break repair nuclease NurA [Phormidium tenue FACHB-886]|nr:DNA double-strand break repair nuclease NurA [Phormidium tenue FACHB-886]